MSEIFQIGDRVFYAGEKYRSRLHGKPGELHARVQNQPDTWIVFFEGTANKKEDQEDTNDYIMSEKVLTKGRPAGLEKADKAEKDKKSEGPEVQQRRKKRTQPEEE